jgi:hypothetical protein
MSAAWPHLSNEQRNFTRNPALPPLDTMTNVIWESHEKH